MPFDSLPDSAFVRAAQLVRNPKHPGRPALLGISAATLWRMIAAGQFPKPTKLSPRITVFRLGDVRRWLDARALEGCAK